MSRKRDVTRLTKRYYLEVLEIESVTGQVFWKAAIVEPPPSVMLARIPCRPMSDNIVLAEGARRTEVVAKCMAKFEALVPNWRDKR